MNIIQLSSDSKQKSLAKVAKDLGLSSTFASPAELQSTVLLLSKHIDELRFRLALVEAEQRHRWYHALMFWRPRT